jgi:hypothetical protein
MFPTSWAPFIGVLLGVGLGAPLLACIYFLATYDFRGQDKCYLCGWERDIHDGQLHPFTRRQLSP